MTAATFAAVLAALLVAHQVADHWVQTEHQAVTKSAPGWAGRWACARHVGSYIGTALLFLGAVVWLLGVPVTVLGVVVGQGVSGVTHYWADRRSTLRRLAWACRKTTFYELGAPRPGRGDNPGLGTGAYALDQSFHSLWLLVAAFCTTLIT
jgi:ABC-type Fe3+ transport system permease subunit